MKIHFGQLMDVKIMFAYVSIMQNLRFGTVYSNSNESMPDTYHYKPYPAFHIQLVE